jgi:O-antigen/teichoic acid export membrane protein
MMNPTSIPAVEAATGSSETAKGAKHSSTNRQIRGSTLLLVGRSLSMAVNFAVQVLIVRHLAKTDYGAFAYVLSTFVLVCQTIATFGLDRAMTRFVPIYHEKEDYDKLFGTIVMVVGTIALLGIITVVAVLGFQDIIAKTMISEQDGDRQLIMALLPIMIGLAPVQAIDDLMAAMFATFASPRSIFFRKYVLAPGLKLLVVGLLIVSGRDVFFLAQGYLAATLLGVLVYSYVLVGVLRKQGLLQHFSFKTINIPAHELLAFTIPLLTSDLVYVVMNASDGFLLERFHNAAEVAAFRVVQPAAVLNQFVLASFTLLFTPAAARMFARNDREGINTLYWQTAIWIAVISFPVFALTFSMAQPLTVLLYEQRYEHSWIILALLSFGYYFNAALGFNGLTLKVYGKLRYIVVINIVAAVLNIAINLLLIPSYGALGAACGTCGTMIVHNILKQAGLGFGTGIKLFDWRYTKMYVGIVLASAGLLAAQFAIRRVLPDASAYIGFALAAGVALLVLAMNRKALNVGQTFPELLKIPLARRFFGV